MVLLKNEGSALPFPGNIKSIAAFGNTSNEIITGGSGSGDVNEAYSVALIEGLGNAGYSIHRSLNDAYAAHIKEAKAKQSVGEGPLAQFMPKPRIEEMEVKSALLKKAAAETDIALITIGRNSGEFVDRTEETDFYLTEREKALIRTVSNDFRDAGKKAVVVLNIGGVIGTAGWRDHPDAILLAWQPGQEAGNAIVDVLSGKVNPSGKLVDSFPLSYSDVPSAPNFPGVILESGSDEDLAGDSGRDAMDLSGSAAEVVYEEDIYVGYRYYNSFDKDVAYEFGYGLSYTQFEYGNLKLGSEEFKDSISISVDVKNIGPVAGKEVVQIYLSAPAEKLDKPREELVAFAKTDLLEPGRSQTLSFALNPRDLASFDPASSRWLAEAGRYEVKIGASSRDIRQTAPFSLGKEIVVKKVNKALVPQREIKRLYPQ